MIFSSWLYQRRNLSHGENKRISHGENSQCHSAIISGRTDSSFILRHRLSVSQVGCEGVNSKSVLNEHLLKGPTEGTAHARTTFSWLGHSVGGEFPCMHCGHAGEFSFLWIGHRRLIPELIVGEQFSWMLTPGVEGIESSETLALICSKLPV